jgi:hypothetical protein
MGSRGLQVFRADDATDLADTTLMERPVMDPVPERDTLMTVGMAPG